MPVVACVAPPPQLPGLPDTQTGSSGSAPTTSGVPPPPSTDGPGVDGTGPTTSDTTAAATTTAGRSSSTGTATDTPSSSSGQPVDCPAPCANNDICVEGTCTSACDPWGSGNYGPCLNAYGGFEVDALCGMGNSCIGQGAPTTATGCLTQGCRDVCDCPAPPATGNALVSCGNLTVGDNAPDCYLSCANGETCPDGMACQDGLWCGTPVVDLPVYGNCGSVASACIDSTCFDDGNFSMCVQNCDSAADCAPAPPGARPAECDLVLFPPAGEDCYFPCTNNADCPNTMVCVQANGFNLCIWEN